MCHCNRSGLYSREKSISSEMSFHSGQDGGWSWTANTCQDGKLQMVCNNPIPLGDGAYCQGNGIETC